MSSSLFLEQMAEVLQVQPEEISVDFELDEQNFDSLALISTISLIDEHFGVTVNVDRLMNCKRIQDILDLVKEKVK